VNAILGGLGAALCFTISALCRMVPVVAAAGAAEVLGILSYAVGARHQLAVAAVLASQFAALTAVAAYFLHGQRLSHRQLAGMAVVIAGVTLLSILSP
jgi:multidrug transporter EmrE-like cation transporter